MNAWKELYIFKEICKDKEKLINEQINFDFARTYRRLLPELNLPVAVTQDAITGTSGNQ
jgi:hypothetical protein